MSLINKFNIDFGDIVVKDAGEKIGSLFGRSGRLIGKIIDALTEDITIKVDNNDDNKK